MGDVMGDLNSRRGQIEGMELRGNAQVIRATVPLAEMFGYADRPALDDPGARDLLDGVRPLRAAAREPRRASWWPEIGAKMTSADGDGAALHRPID